MRNIYTMKKRSLGLVYSLSCFIIFLLVSIPFCLSIELNLTYDGNGNLITGDGKYREYNEFNQLIRIRNGTSVNDSILEEYVYHPTEDRILAKRVYKTYYYEYHAYDHLDETVIYVNDNLVRTVTYPAASQVNTSDKIYIKDESGIVAEFNSSQNKVFYSNDHLGSTGVLTNESGSVIEQTFYEPFGGIISGGNASRFYYEGKDYSQVISEYDFNFRKYSPELKFFVKPDSGVNNVYDPQGLNRYTFERNNPYKYVDPDGKAAIPYHFIGAYRAGLNAGYGIIESGLLAIGSTIPDLSPNNYGKYWYHGYPGKDEKMYIESHEKSYYQNIKDGNYFAAGIDLHALVDLQVHGNELKDESDLKHFKKIDATFSALRYSFSIPSSLANGGGSNIRLDQSSVNSKSKSSTFNIGNGGTNCDVICNSYGCQSVQTKPSKKDTNSNYCQTHSDPKKC